MGVSDTLVDDEKPDVMCRFDALPADVRRAISNAAFQYHPQSAEKILKRGVESERCAELLIVNDPHRPKRNMRRL